MLSEDINFGVPPNLLYDDVSIPIPVFPNKTSCEWFNVCMIMKREIAFKAISILLSLHEGTSPNTLNTVQ